MRRKMITHGLDWPALVDKRKQYLANAAYHQRKIDNGNGKDDVGSLLHKLMHEGQRNFWERAVTDCERQLKSYGRSPTGKQLKPRRSKQQKDGDN